MCTRSVCRRTQASSFPYFPACSFPIRYWISVETFSSAYCNCMQKIHRDDGSIPLSLATITHLSLIKHSTPRHQQRKLQTRNQRKTTMHLSPELIDSFHQPKQLADTVSVSTTKRRCRSSFAKLLSPASSTAFKVSPCPDPNSRHYHCHSDELLYTERRTRGVRFAPKQTSDTIRTIGLDDYSSEEIGACWYTAEELGRTQERRSRRNNSKKTKKRFQCRLFSRK